LREHAQPIALAFRVAGARRGRAREPSVAPSELRGSMILKQRKQQVTVLACGVAVFLQPSRCGDRIRIGLGHDGLLPKIV
jgi:hypothetical protein